VFWAAEGGHELGTKPRGLRQDEARAAQPMRAKP
jgi:hypothetical protein